MGREILKVRLEDGRSPLHIGVFMERNELLLQGLKNLDLSREPILVVLLAPCLDVGRQILQTESLGLTTAARFRLR